MRRHTAIVGCILLIFLLLVGMAAFAQDASAGQGGMSLQQIGTSIGTIVVSALVAGGGILGAQRLGPKPPSTGGDLPPAVTELMARLDERTSLLQDGQVAQGSRLELMAKRQHRHSNALLVLLLREGHSPEEQSALAALQDESDSEDGDTPLKVGT